MVSWNGMVDRGLLQCSLQNAVDGVPVQRLSSGLLQFITGLTLQICVAANMHATAAA